MENDRMRDREISQYLCENAAIGIYQTSAAGHYAIANPALAHILGYDSPEDLINSVTDIDRQVFADPFRQREFHRLLEESGRVKNFEAELFRKDGKRVWVSIQADAMVDAIDDPNNMVSSYQGFLIDITKQKQRDDAKQESESKLAAIIEFLPDATFVIDLQGKVIAWNRAMEEMTGVKKKDMIGQGDHAYAVPFYGERRRQLLDLLDKDDKEIASNYQYVQRKGNTLYAEVFTPALFGGSLDSR